MVIETKDILQADAAIIAGVIVLLTITQLFGGAGRAANLRRGRFVISVLLSVSIFSISASFALFEQIEPSKNIMMLGFITLLITVGMVLWILIQPMEERRFSI